MEKCFFVERIFHIFAEINKKGIAETNTKGIAETIKN